MRPLLWVLCSAAALAAAEFRFDSAASWSTWKMPHGLIEFDDSGRLQLVKFRKGINAVADAPHFTHLTRSRGANVPGGIWEAGSNPTAARRIIDGDRQTFWQASADDALGDWFVQIDLGRAVLANEIRLHFPDQAGARPFRQFTVFTATGITSDALDDLFIFRPVYLTTQPNRATTVSIPLAFDLQDSAQVLDPNRDVDLEKFNQYRLIQYINFTVEDFDPEGALAEIEVIAVGDNVSLGNDQRGGIIDGLTARSTENILDGDMNTASSILPVGFEGRVRTWEDQGTWFFIDLGAVFWLDELFLYVLRPREGTVGSVAGAPRGFTFLHSDGTRVISSQLPIPESFDFATLIDQPDPDPMRYLRYLFQPRRVRYLFWHAHTPQGWGSRWTELMLFSPGHPAKVVMRSDFIDLGAGGRRRPPQSHQQPLLGRRPPARHPPTGALALRQHPARSLCLSRQDRRANHRGEVAQPAQSAAGQNRHYRRGQRGLGCVERGVHLFRHGLQVAKPAPLRAIGDDPRHRRSTGGPRD